MSGRPTVLIDLDDTLIECGIYYRDAIVEGGRLIAKYTGLATGPAQALIRSLDLVALEHNPTFSKNRFPRSFGAAMAAAYELLAVDSAHEADAMREVLDAGWSVFEAPYALKPDALHVLTELRARGYQLVLVTKGDQWVQERKVGLHGLRSLVDAVEIVPDKRVTTWQDVWLRHRVDKARTYVIGDSLKDDIAPNRVLGAATLLVHSALSWSFNDHEVKPDAEVEALLHVLDYVPPIPRDTPHLVHG